MSGFDRIKPPEERLRDREGARRPGSDEADPTGRAAVFRSPGAAGAAGPAEPAAPRPEGLPDGPSLLHVECQHCGITCPVPLGDAVRRAVPMVVLAPWRSHPVFATCPCGERRAWLKPRLGPSR